MPKQRRAIQRAEFSQAIYSVRLRVRHPTIDPEVVTQALQLQPSNSWRGGTPRAGEKGSTPAGQHRDTYWLASLPQRTFRLEHWATPESSDALKEPSDALAALVNDVELAGLGSREAKVLHMRFGIEVETSDPLQSQVNLESFLAQQLLLLRQRAEFFNQLRSEGGEVTLVIEITPSAAAGFKLSGPLLRRLTALGIELEFEFAVD